MSPAPLWASVLFSKIGFGLMVLSVLVAVRLFQGEHWIQALLLPPAMLIVLGWIALTFNL